MFSEKAAKAIKLLLNPVRLYETFVVYTPRLWSDRYYIRCKFHWRHRRWLDLEHPRTFNEKIQWLKLNEWQDIYPVLVDKVRVKEWVAARIGEDHIIPTIGVWERAEDIDFDHLPDKFVLKCNHNSHKGLCICRDKSALNRKKVVKELRRGLKEDYSAVSREPAYGKVPRRILAEKLIEDSSGDLRDYKFFCNNGRVGCIMVCGSRNTREGLHLDLYDTEWNKLPFVEEFPNLKQPVQKPERYEEMTRIAETLSKGFRFARVDLYLADGSIYFGEMTFHPGGGFDRFDSEEAELWMGRLIDIPSTSKHPL